MSEVNLRLATKDDMNEVHKLIKELMDFEDVTTGLNITAEDLIKDGFETEPPLFYSHVAECDATKKLLGYTIWFVSFSINAGRSTYIEDIYVKPEYRHLKIGHKLLKAACRTGVDMNANQIDWHVLNTNLNAQKFYQRHGAYDLGVAEQQAALRFEEHAILNIAKDN